MSSFGIIRGSLEFLKVSHNSHGSFGFLRVLGIVGLNGIQSCFLYTKTENHKERTNLDRDILSAMIKANVVV